MLDQIKIVLSHTTHPGNIGATARAMKVMGMSKLSLVKPKRFPCAEATERASRANDLLLNAEQFESVDEAVQECRLVVGTSARHRTLSNPVLTPRELVQKIVDEPQRVPVAILFGTENSGLTNEELQLCHYQLYIPTNPDYSSLNLAQAVQLIAYELWLGLGENVPHKPPHKAEKPDPLLTAEETSGVIQHLKDTMARTGYLRPETAKYIDQRLYRIINKAALTRSEMNLLRGFLSSVDKYVAK